MTEKYEAVVVGAGPAGLATAKALADKGVQTLVLERGKKPGTKNATGGILYGSESAPYNIEDAFGNFHEEAPVERPIDDYWMHCLAGDKVKSIDITPLHHHDHKWSYSVLRGPLDQWLGKETHKACREHGGGLLSSIRVTGPLIEDDRVVGVKTNELEDIRADLVIAADGATSEMVRKVGLRGWGEPENWFQGTKVVVNLPNDGTVEERFGLDKGRGTAHLFAGDLFGDVRGGGFVYTNKDSLSIGTVFHLDSLAEVRTSPHKLMDRLLLHPTVQQWIGAEGEEVEYSAKLIPDGKKMAIKKPYKGSFLAVGDAAGQLIAQGPVIKGMNVGITSGILAANSFLEARAAGRTHAAGELYGRMLRKHGLMRELRPMRYKLVRQFAENEFANDMLGWMAGNALGRRMLRGEKGVARVQSMMSNARLAAANPDINFGYVTLPTIVATENGQSVEPVHVWTPRTIEERIAALDYDTDIGKPHILLKDNAPNVSGRAVTTCPVSEPGFSGGCYRIETVKTPSGSEEDVVALDVQPCIECGTCALMAATAWSHPSGGKGVGYQFG